MTSEIDRRDPAAPADPVRDGGARLVRHLAADLRRSRGPDRRHAADARRREAVDRPAPVPARHELLHAAARPGGPAAGDLRRLAAARHARRAGRRRAVRAARRRRPAGAVGDLRRVRLHHRGDGAVRRSRARGAGDRRPGGGPGREAGPDQPGAGRRSRSPRSWRSRCSRCRSRWSSWWPGCSAGRCTAGGRPPCPEGSQKDAADDGPPPVIPDDVLHTELPVDPPRRSACC